MFGGDEGVEFIGKEVDVVSAYPLIIEDRLGVFVSTRNDMRPLVGYVVAGACWRGRCCTDWVGEERRRFVLFGGFSRYMIS